MILRTQIGFGENTLSFTKNREEKEGKLPTAVYRVALTLLEVAP